MLRIKLIWGSIPYGVLEGYIGFRVFPKLRATFIEVLGFRGLGFCFRVGNHIC